MDGWIFYRQLDVAWKAGDKMNRKVLEDSNILVINGRKYDKRQLCVDWFRMSNDAFFKVYGFNFNPHEYPGLYDWGRKTLYGLS